MIIQDNLKPFIIGVIVLFLGVGSFTFYRHQQEQKELQVSNTYEDLLTAVRQKNKEKMHEIASNLIKTYPKTNYAALASLIEAKTAIDEKKYDEAVNQYQWIVKENKTFLQEIAQLRLARVLVEQQKYDEALATLNAPSKDNTFLTLKEEIKGDIYLLQNDKEKARQAYQIALSKAPTGAPIARIQLKQNDLNQLNAKIAEKKSVEEHSVTQNELKELNELNESNQTNEFNKTNQKKGDS